jgi:membrane fusion protein, multidrug efflux system
MIPAPLGQFTLWALGALLMSLTACTPKNTAPPQRPPVTVQTALATADDIPEILATFGVTEERASIDVMPQVSGLLVETLIREGETVTNGQVLFRIDPQDYALRVAQREGQLAAAQAQFNLSQSTLERNRSLLEKKLISTETFDTLKTRRDAASAQLQIEQAALAQARLDLSRCTLTAPIEGICAKRLVDTGNLVTAGQTHLINIRSYDPLDVEFSVPERHLSALRRALTAGPVPVEIFPRNGETIVGTGTIVFINNTVDSQTGTILLRGRIPNPDLTWWSRQFVDIRIAAGGISQAVMVPESALQFGKQGPYLFVVSAENKADLRPVKTGARYEGHIQIVTGVAAGEKVVTLGHLMLAPGAVVVEAPPPGPPAGRAP